MITVMPGLLGVWEEHPTTEVLGSTEIVLQFRKVTRSEMGQIFGSCRANMANRRCGTMMRHQDGCRLFSPIKNRTVQFTILDHLARIGRSPSTLNKMPTVFMEYVSTSAMKMAIITLTDSSSRTR